MAEAWDKSGQLVGVEGLLRPPGAETVGHMRRLVGMYLEEVVRLREAESLEVSNCSRFFDTTGPKLTASLT